LREAFYFIVFCCIFVGGSRLGEDCRIGLGDIDQWDAEFYKVSLSALEIVRVVC